MENQYSFKDVVKSSITGSHCVYSLVFVDIPSLFTTYLLANFTKVNANSITYLGAMLSIISILFIFYSNILIALALFYLAFICDFMDGKISRLRKTSSHFGKKLDLAFDRIIFSIIGFSYVYYLEENSMNYEKLLLIFYLLIFLLYDVLELTSVMVKQRIILEKIKYKLEIGDYFNKEKNESYFHSITSLKRWFPSRVFSITLVYFFAPLINFKYFYSLAILSIVFRLMWLMINYFKK